MNRYTDKVLLCSLYTFSNSGASSLALEAAGAKKEIAAKVGELIAQRAKEAGVESVVFDRNGYLYHGRIKELADAARNGGLKF